jgi:hypothetical protein
VVRELVTLLLLLELWELSDLELAVTPLVDEELLDEELELEVLDELVSEDAVTVDWEVAVERELLVLELVEEVTLEIEILEVER